MKRILFALLFACVVLLPLAVEALTVAPLRQTTAVNPGEETVASIFVVNETDAPFTVTPEVDAFIADPETGSAVFGAADAALSWITPQQQALTLAPQEFGQLDFTVRPPADVPPGAHYLGLFAKKCAGDGYVGVGSRVGSLFFLHVAGAMVESLSVRDFSVGSRSLFEHSATVFLDIKNSGNIHVIPEGTIVIRDWRGNSMEHIAVTQHAKVLAGGQLQREFVVAPHAWWHVGKITATLQMPYGVTERIATAQVSWWYVSPVVGFAGLGLGILVLLIFLKKRTRH